MDLAADVTVALLEREGLANPLAMLEAYEVADWDKAEVLAGDMGLPSQRLASLYIEGLEWSRRSLTAFAIQWPFPSVSKHSSPGLVPEPSIGHPEAQPKRLTSAPAPRSVDPSLRSE